jgi:hypothetical protein
MAPFSLLCRTTVPCPFQNGKVCPPAPSEAGARRPRSSANYSDSSTNLLTKVGFFCLTQDPII